MQALILKNKRDYQQSFSATTIIPFKIGHWLDSHVTLQAEYRQAKCNKFFDLSFNHSKWIGLAMLQNNIILSTKPDIRMELTGLYLSPSIQGSYDLNHIWAIRLPEYVGTLLAKTSIQVKANDLFNSMEGNIDVTLRNKGQYMDAYATTIHAHNFVSTPQVPEV